MSIFLNSAGRLRSGWRLLIFIVLFIAILFFFTAFGWIVYALILNFAPTLVPRPILQDLIYRVLYALAALAAGFICTYLLEGLPWRALGLSLHSGWLKDFTWGSIIGIGALALATIIATIGGGLSFTFSGRDVIVAVIKTLVASAVIFVFAALAEEALFRGYPLQTLTRAQLFWLGVLLTSLPFAAAHFDNPNATKLGLANTALAGVWFGIGYLKTRSLWLPLGLHWSWNWALASLFGLPVSGLTHLAPNPLLRGVDLGPSWLTGGSYGIEGGLACTIAMIFATVFTWWNPLVSASPEMKELTSAENPAVQERISIIADETSA